ncbi:hypothetical protein KDK77_06580 [bacterium]|nr:hypothetical protein [bacterium]
MGIITRQFNYVAGRTIRASEVNKNENVLYDEINGNIEDVNIKSESLTARVMADDVNPLVRDAEKYENHIQSGFDVADISGQGTAKVAVTAGTAYTIYNGRMYRTVNTSTQTHILTNTGNGTYFLHVDYLGTLTDSASVEGGNGKQVLARLEVSGQPSTPIITVTDLRNTQLYFVASHYVSGCTMKYLSAHSIRVNGGIIEIAGRSYANSNGQTVDISDDENYIGSETAVGTSQWCYVYVAPLGTSFQWQVKLSVNPPQYSDTNNAASGALRYRLDSSVYYRCIGAVFNDSAGNIVPFFQHDAYIQYRLLQNVVAGSAVPANLPAISQRGYFRLYGDSNTDLKIARIRAAGTSDSYMEVRTGTPDGSGADKATAFVSCFANESQQLEVFLDANCTCHTVGFWINVR